VLLPARFIFLAFWVQNTKVKCQRELINENIAEGKRNSLSNCLLGSRKPSLGSRGCPHPSPHPLPEVGGRRSEAGFFVLTLALTLALSQRERGFVGYGEGILLDMCRGDLLFPLAPLGGRGLG